MKWYTRSCERPLKRSASEALPSSVSNRYSLSIRTHGNSCRRFASSSLRRGSSFSALSRLRRAAVHSLRVPVLCFVLAGLFSFCVPFIDLIFVVPPHPLHGRLRIFVAAFRNKIEKVVGANQKIETTPVCGIGVKDVAGFV